jgi:DNA polymerase elongation subunit (family B)
MTALPEPAPAAYVSAHLRDDAHVVALSRGPAGELRRRVFPAEWVSYYGEDLAPDLLRILRETSFVRGIRREGAWWRVSWVDRRARQLMVEDPNSPLRQAGAACYEGDVHPVARWAADAGVRVQAPRRVYLDIETDSRVSFADAVEGGARVLCVALVSEDGTTLRVARLLNADTDVAEAQLLEWMWRELAAYDQVVAWNGDGFDFPVLFARTRKLRLQADANLWLWIDQLEVFKRMNMHSAGTGDEKRSMALENIGQAVTGRGKLQVPEWARAVVGGRALGAATWDLWAAGGRHRQLLLDYNLEDADLLRAIEAERPYLALLQTICEACGVFANTRGLNPTVQMDGFMLRLGLQRGHHFATREYREAAAQFKGAWVMQPRTHGIARGVHVCDFKSLYPSIMLSFNMSPETKRQLPSNGPVPPGIARTPTGVSFDTTVEGVLVAALRELLRLRDHYKKLENSLPPGTDEWKRAHNMSTAYKVVANSFYGVLSSYYSRFCDTTIGEGITQTAKWLCKATMAAAEERGWKGVYSDTDSSYVQGPTEDEFRAFTVWCNTELYPRLLREQGCVENHIRVAYEKEFETIVFLAAKKYVARYAHREGKRATEESEPEIKGMEYVRGDALRLACTMQGEVIDMLVGRLHEARDGGAVPTTDLARYNAVLARYRELVLEGELGVDDLKLSKALNKPLREYAVKTKNDGTAAGQPPHVQVAHVLKERGEEVREGTRIDYVVADGSRSPMRVIPASDYTGTEADRYYLWESLVYPPTQRLVEAAFPPADERGRPRVEHDWSRWAKVRPSEGRGRNRVLEGQQALFGGGLRPGVPTTSPSVPPAALSAPGDTRVSPPAPIRPRYEVRAALGDDDEMLALEALVAAHPGGDDLDVVLAVGGLPGPACEVGRFDVAALAADPRARGLRFTA